MDWDVDVTILGAIICFLPVGPYGRTPQAAATGRKKIVLHSPAD